MLELKITAELKTEKGTIRKQANLKTPEPITEPAYSKHYQAAFNRMSMFLNFEVFKELQNLIPIENKTGENEQNE